MTNQQPVVLLVEDERDLADLYNTWLAERYAVRTAYTGDQAMDSLDADVDVALLDRRLPHWSGDDILAEIREQEYDCQVAMVSAVDPGLDLIDMGFDSYLTKPFDKSDLLELTEQLVSRQQLSEQTKELYRLVEKRALLEAELAGSVLDQSDEFEQLVQRIDTLQDQLDGKLTEVLAKEEDVEELWKSFFGVSTP